MKFTKMHGCGNDYIYVNCFQEHIEDRELTARTLSDRHFGIGADGMICIDPSEVADFKMDMYNSDGSQGKMCGNGIRCVGKYVYDYGLTDKTCITVETLGGIKTLYLYIEDDTVRSVRVCMESPIFAPKQIPVLFDGDAVIHHPMDVGSDTWNVTCVSMGNPHAVTFVNDVKSMELEKIGPMFEFHECFPERINTEFVQVLDEENILLRVWERGSGETLACGTGTCAAVVASILNGKTKEIVTAHTMGGDLLIEWDRSNNLVFMTGPAEIVFEGEVK